MDRVARGGREVTQVSVTASENDFTSHDAFPSMH